MTRERGGVGEKTGQSQRTELIDIAAGAETKSAHIVGESVAPHLDDVVAIAERRKKPVQARSQLQRPELGIWASRREGRDARD